MKCRSAVGDTLTILAIDRLETSFSRSIWISASLPSSLDAPKEPFGRPSQRPLAGPLAGLVGRADRTIDPQVIAEQWDHMGQFYASLESGHTTASVALKRLASCTAKNRFYRANRDLGRVFKTEFLLGYVSEPQLRARIRRGLLKVEQRHALARDVYYGRRGRINARELHEQMNSCSCLTLILACVIYWQAKEISRVVRWCQPEGEKIDVALLEHVSPIEWDNVILYGQYVLDRAQVR